VYEVGSTSGSIYVSISNSTLVFLSSTNIRIMSTVIFTYVIIGHAPKSPFIIVGRFVVVAHTYIVYPMNPLS